MRRELTTRKPELEATRIPTPIDIAWAAGIYEGEGTCRVRRSEAIELSVTQKDPEILYRLRDWFGGKVCDNGAHNGVHIWCVYGNHARIFLTLCYPRLSARRRAQADVTGALRFLQGASPDGLSMSALKDKMLCYYEEHKEASRKRINEAKKTKYYARKATSAKVVAIA